MNLSQISAGMKCYFYCEQNNFSVFFDDPFLDDAVIYTNAIPLKYNERECMYTEFTGNPTGTMPIVTKKESHILIESKK